MDTTLTRKGQVTIPKKIRQTLGLHPGSQVAFDLDECGRIVIRKVEDTSKPHIEEQPDDRFSRMRGRATVEWTTDELMRLLR